MTGEGRTLLVVSHPNVFTHNQTVYMRMAELGWRIALIVPNRWRDEYSPDGFIPQPLPGLVGRFARVRVARPGSIQRHFYVTRPSRWLAQWRPDVAFFEQEPFSIPGLQWGIACERAGIPWGLQGDENVDRPFPWPARLIRRWTLRHGDYFAARSPRAGDMLRQWGARGQIGVVPHTIPEWAPSLPRRDGSFTIGFAGRLVAAKGIPDLMAAVRQLEFPFRLLVVGDGPMRAELERADLGRGVLALRTGVRTEQMPALYREMDVLVLPSRTTPTWAEQFGRVLCEALLCGIPVVGSSSGEIPWVIETSGGGRTFPEGDATALASVLSELHADPQARAALAQRGAEGVEHHFSPRVAAQALDRLIRTALRSR
ncbi:MAG TPA: glycosyltransferase family 4 protein [Solirubrobacteraceae bacterium]|nr:glycosyltransferase family 4 protein [Solirubrobacteraceae bacterium]